MASEKEPEFPRLAPAAGPSPEGSPVFFGVTMPRRWPQGWRLWGDFVDGVEAMSLTSTSFCDMSWTPMAPARAMKNSMSSRSCRSTTTIRGGEG